MLTGLTGSFSMQLLSNNTDMNKDSFWGNTKNSKCVFQKGVFLCQNRKKKRSPSILMII